MNIMLLCFTNSYCNLLMAHLLNRIHLIIYPECKCKVELSIKLLVHEQLDIIKRLSITLVTRGYTDIHPVYNNNNKVYIEF